MISQYWLYFVLLLLSVGSWFLADLFDDSEIKLVNEVANSPDYYSLGYYKKEMTEGGLVKNELTADKMIHYADDETTHLENPIMTLYNSENKSEDKSDHPPWIIKAEGGILQSKKDLLLLTGQVLISKESTETHKPFMIRTSELQVTLSTNYAETNQWAEIIDTPNTTEGVGMEVTFVAPIKLKFLTNVKGRYEIN